MGKKRFFNDYNLTLLILVIIFFFVYAYFSLSVWLPNFQKFGQIIYTWPDAMANQAFVNQMTKTGNFIISVPENDFLADIIHPRSVNAFNGDLVPMGFLGLPLIYGYLGKLIGISGTLFITPLIASLSILVFYSFTKRFLKKKGAFIASVLLMTLGAYVYYATQVMLSAVLFIGLLIAGLWFLTYKNARPNRKFVAENIFIGIGGFFIGLALIVRTSEAPWVLLICSVIFLFFGRKQWYFKLPIFFAGCFLPFIAVILENKLLYGSYLSFGYLKLYQPGSFLNRLPDEFQISATNKFLSACKLIFLPFGFHPRLLWHNFYRYFLAAFYPYLIFATAGLAWFLIDKNKRAKEWAYLICAVLCGFWLIFYYGNWQFQDLLVLTYNNIGSSYTRYWLPLYVLMLPAGGYFFAKLLKSPLPKYLSRIFVIISVLILAVYSYFWAVTPPKDGLAANKLYLEQYYDRYQKVTALIEPDALIIVDRMDKVFFPKYQVVVFLQNYDIFNELKKIPERQVYYFTDMNNETIDLINQEKLVDFGMRFDEPRIIDDEYQLFHLNTHYEDVFVAEKNQ